MPGNIATADKSDKSVIQELVGDLPRLGGLGFRKPSELASEISESLNADKSAGIRSKAFDVLVNYLGTLSAEGRSESEMGRFAAEVLVRVAKDLVRKQGTETTADIIEGAPHSPVDVRDMLLATIFDEKLDDHISNYDRARILMILNNKDLDLLSGFEFPRTLGVLKANPQFFIELGSELPPRMRSEFDAVVRHSKVPELQRIGSILEDEGEILPEDYLLVVQMARKEPELMRGSYIASQLQLDDQILAQLAKIPEGLFLGTEPAPIIKLAQIFDRTEIANGIFLHRNRDPLSLDGQDPALDAEQFLAAGLSPLMQAQVIEVSSSTLGYKILLELGTLSASGEQSQREILNLIGEHQFGHEWDIASHVNSVSPSQLERFGASLAVADKVGHYEVALLLTSYLNYTDFENTVHLLRGYLSAGQKDGEFLLRLYEEFFNRRYFDTSVGAQAFAMALMGLEATTTRAQLLPPIFRNVEWQDAPAFTGGMPNEAILAELLIKYVGNSEVMSKLVGALESSNITGPLLVSLVTNNERPESQAVLKFIVENMKGNITVGLASEKGYQPADTDIAKVALQVVQYGTSQQQAIILSAIFSESQDLHKAISQFLSEYPGDIEALSAIVAAGVYRSDKEQEIAPTMAMVLHELGSTQDAERILEQVIEKGITGELVDIAIRELSPNLNASFILRNWATYGAEVLDRIVRGESEAVNRQVMSDGFDISSEGLDAIFNHAPQRVRGPLNNVTRRQFFRAVLQDSSISDNDRISFARAASEVSISWSLHDEVRSAAEAGAIKYSSNSRKVWERYLDGLDLREASSTILPLEGFPKQRAATAMLFGITDNNLSPVLESLVARGSDTFFIPVWKQVISNLDSNNVKQVLDALSRIENLSPQIARLQYDRIRSQRLASDSLFAKSTLIMANVKQTEEVRRSWLVGTPAEQQLAQLREQVKGGNLPATIHPEKLVPHQPAPVEAIARIFLLQVCTAQGLKQLASAIERNSFSEQVNNLLVSASPENQVSREFIEALAREAILMATRNQLNVREVKGSAEFKIWPVAQGPAHMPRVSPQIAKQTMAIIGGGPAALIAARFRHEMGYLPSSTTIFSQAPTLGGIWRQRNVVDEGHNTFRAASLFGARLDANEPRPGSELVSFLDQLAGDKVKSQLHQGEVTRIQFRKEDEKYVVFGKNGKNEVIVGLFDSVLVCTGNRKARPLNSRVMRSNIDSVERAPLERWQREIRPDEYKEFEAKSPIMIGLGNSTMAMIGEFMKMQSAGHHVNPRILTHLSLDLLQDPGKVIQTGEGEIQGPLYRNPSGLNRVAGDIGRIQERLDHALQQGWIISDVKSWHVTDNRQDGGEDLSIAVSTKSEKVIIDRVPRIFGLIGYQNDPEMMNRFGCKSDPKTGIVKFDPRTGRVYEKSSAGNRMYVAGTAASSNIDRNQEVIPGMLRSIPLIMFSELLAGEG